MRRPTPRRVQQMKKDAARLSLILRLVKKDYSYAEIAEMIEPKISRQRVWQIVKAAKG